MLITLHIRSLGSFVGSILILIFALYSLIYLRRFKTHRFVFDFFSLQISLFLFLFGHGMYASGHEMPFVLFWTRICFFGAVTVISTGFRFCEAVRGEKNRRLGFLFDSIAIIISLFLFLPGEHFFTSTLEIKDNYASIIKGPFFPLFIVVQLGATAFSLARLARYILADPERKKLGVPVLAGLIGWFLTSAFDAVFAAVLALTRPNPWVGPTVMSLCLAIFTVRIFEDRFKELERVIREKNLIYKNLINDRITGLYTREYILEILYQKIAQQKRAGVNGALLFCDIDNFKLINDELGHKTGDEVLALLGVLLKQGTRAGDIPARYGGDEFLVLLNDCTPHGAEAAAKTVQENFEKEFNSKLASWDKKERISLSTGIVLCRDWDDTPEQTIHRADLAMYKSKRLGKGRVSIYTGDEE